MDLLLPAVADEIGKKDTTYKREIKRFVKHVENTAGLAPDEHGHYATTANIVSFFQIVVQNRTGAPASASRVAPALQSLVAAEQCLDEKDMCIRQVL